MDVFTLDAGGARLAVRVTPRARRSAVAGIFTGEDGRPALAVRLRAPPVDGAANKALIVFLAEALALPASSLSIASGETARLKIVRITGDPRGLGPRLDAWTGAAPADLD